MFVGTIYPLALEALTGQKISVGAPFYNTAFIPISIPVFLAMPLGSSLAWKRGDLLGAAQRMMIAMLAGIAALLVFAWIEGAPVMSYVMAGLAVFVIVGSFADLARRIGAGGWGNAWARGTGLPRSAWGTSVAHAGLGVTLLGLAAAGWGQETIVAMKPGDVATVGPYTAQLVSVVPEKGPNYEAAVARTLLSRNGDMIARLEPASRFYPVRKMARAEAGIVTLGLGQFYESIGSPVAGSPTIDVKLYWKPLVTLIWIGALIMGLGGALSLSDRRLRFGIAARARRAHVTAVPAE